MKLMQCHFQRASLYFVLCTSDVAFTFMKVAILQPGLATPDVSLLVYYKDNYHYFRHDLPYSEMARMLTRFISD